MKKINESPDYIILNGKKIQAKDKSHRQRSIIIFKNGQIWVSAIGESHEEMYDYDLEAPDISGSLMGRVWLDLGIISFWDNPFKVFGEEYMDYIYILKDELKRYGINIKKLKFDTYNTWEPAKRKYVDSNLMVRYYDDSSHQYITPLDTYEDYLGRIEEYRKRLIDSNKGHEKISTAPKGEFKPPMGSYKTGWDSDSNLKNRQSRYTSESFYPILHIS